MNGLEMLIARGIAEAGHTPVSPMLVNSIAKTLRENADEVRVIMQHQVWGTVV